MSHVALPNERFTAQIGGPQALRAGVQTDSQATLKQWLLRARLFFARLSRSRVFRAKCPRSTDELRSEFAEKSKGAPPLAPSRLNPSGNSSVSQSFAASSSLDSPSRRNLLSQGLAGPPSCLWRSVVVSGVLISMPGIISRELLYQPLPFPDVLTKNLRGNAFPSLQPLRVFRYPFKRGYTYSSRAIGIERNMQLEP